MGAANRHSIAWGVARVLHAAGAELAFTAQDETLAGRIAPIIAPVSAHPPLVCDVAQEGAPAQVFQQLRKAWGADLDFVVHSIAGASRHDLAGDYLRVSAENFRKAMEISCYSLTEVARASEPFMANGGAILSLSYLGAERVVPNYNVMGVAKAALEASVRYLAADLGAKGIRINALSAGPVRTSSGAAISAGRYIFAWSAQNALLKHNPESHELGRSALYLVSSLSEGVTGEVLHVDGGLHAVAIPRRENATLETAGGTKTEGKTGGESDK